MLFLNVTDACDIYISFGQLTYEARVVSMNRDRRSHIMKDLLFVYTILVLLERKKVYNS